MVTSELRDGIVWIIIEGQMTSQDIISTANKWRSQTDAISGFITDLRQVTGVPSPDDQKILAEWRRQNSPDKPHAMLGRTNAMGVMLQIYTRLTNAEAMQYFMDPEAAIAWVKGFDQQ
jgi:hypothetical protein